MQKKLQTIHTPNRLLCFLLLIFPILLLSMFISYLFYQDEKEHLNVLHKGVEKQSVNIQQDKIRQLFLDIDADLKILAEFYIAFSSDKEYPSEFQERFSRLLYLFSVHRQGYDQIRLIGKDGMERIRINLVAGRSVITPEENLRNKGRRYYFQDTMKLHPGEIFISPFDLNMEHGEIEIPYKPMLRFGTPVTDRDGNKQGVVMLNYLGRELLDQLAEQEANRLHRKFMLLNRDGYWLYGERRDDAWAFMHSGCAGHTFGARYPEAWKIIASDHAGQFVIDGNLYTFITIYPLTGDMSSSAERSDVFGKSQRKIRPEQYYWKLLTRIPIEQIEYEYLLPVKYSLVLFNLVLLILLGPAGWLMISFYVSREAARRELNRFKNVLDQTLDCVFMFDPESLQFTYVNQGGQKQVGYCKEEFLKMTPLCIKPEYSETMFRKLIAPLRSGEAENLIFQTVHRDKHGTRIPVEVYLQYIKPGRDKACFVAIVRDISERKQVMKALKAAHQRLLTVLDGLDAIVYVIDLDSYELLFLNKYAVNIFGDVTGSICWKNLQKDMDSPCPFCPNALLRGKKYEGRSYTWERQNPFNGRWYEMHDRAIKWLDGRDVKIQIATDITERRRMEQQLHYNAYHDCLTGLANRLFFYERLEQEVFAAERGRSKLALIFVDLNRFKPVNDQYGHDAGDFLLQEVARRLLSSVRRADLVARMGGDEFILLLPGIQSREDVLRVAAKVSAALERPCRLPPDIEVFISAATGTAVYPDDGVQADELLRAADQLMYSNKQNGKNCS